MLPCIYRVSRYNLLGCHYREIYLYLKEEKIKKCMKDDIINIYSQKEKLFNDLFNENIHLEIELINFIFCKFRILILIFIFMNYCSL